MRSRPGLLLAEPNPVLNGAADERYILEALAEADQYVGAIQCAAYLFGSRDCAVLINCEVKVDRPGE